MSIFASIMEKLVGGGARDAALPDLASVLEFDVVAQMEQRTADHPQHLYWRHSILDMLKLLDIDSSLDMRKALAAELGAPAKVMLDSAHMNLWLHKEVLKRIAANGGNVPAGILE
jgi:hypothetical protein